MSWSDGSDPDALRPGSDPDSDPGRSRCVLGVVPVVYYTVLLCVGLPVNCLALAALCRLCARSKSPLYAFLVSMTTADMLAQVCIVLVDFLLETAVFHRAVPPLLLRVVSAVEFGANHASIWAAVPLTVDRYAALCHPLLHRRLRSPSRTRRTIGAVILLALASGIPFFYWPDLWRTQTPPTARDAALIWSHVTIIYFLPCSIFLTLNARIVWTLRHRSRLRLEPADLKPSLQTAPLPVGPPRPVTLSVGSPRPVTLSVGSPRPVTLSVGSPRPVALSVGSPRPVALSVGSPRPVTLSVGSPRPVALSVGSPRPVALSVGSPRPVTLSVGSPRPVTLPVGSPRSVALLLWLSGAFSLLWGPRVVALLLHLHLSTVNRSWGVHLLYDLANMAAMLNTALNLLLYCATSRPIRRAAHDVVCDIIRSRAGLNRE